MKDNHLNRKTTTNNNMIALILKNKVSLARGLLKDSLLMKIQAAGVISMKISSLKLTRNLIVTQNSNIKIILSVGSNLRYKDHVS